MKIGIITVEDLNDKKAWSGIVYKMYKQLCTLYGQENISHLRTHIDFWGKVYFFLYRCFAYMFGKGGIYLMRFMSKRMAASVSSSMLEEVDVIYAPAGAVDIAYLETKKPIIYYSDATFKLLYNYYPWRKLFKRKVKEAYEVEKRAMNKANYLLFSSHWAKQSAISDYGIPAEKVFVIEFGANIEDEDIRFRKRKFENNDVLKLLFIGVVWGRKGGNIAVDCCRCLKSKNIDVELHIVGISQLPQEYSKLDFIINHGFLNKNKIEEYTQLVSIINLCDILILPTRAECSAIVLAEASAFGLPIFTYDTGGLANYVKNGVNGYRLSLNCRGNDFAVCIDNVLKNDELGNLSLGGRKLYEERLNWNHWGKEFNNVLNLIIE